MERRTWFERRFELGLSRDVLPDVVERLRGTPLRVEERTAGVDPTVLTRRMGDRWSIQENVGHLLDLEDLWIGRLDDFREGRSDLRPADLQNRATWDGNHNDRRMRDLLEGFRQRREELLSRLTAIPPEDLERTALHPRLGQPMSVVDLCFFLAEHDDHHLAAITELRRVLTTGD